MLLAAAGQDHREDGDHTGAQHPADDEAPGVAAPAAQQDGDVRDEPERFDRDDQGEADGGEHGSAWQREACRGGTSRVGGQSRAT